MENIAGGELETRQKTILWLVPILFTVHNLEEMLFIDRFLHQISDFAPSFLQKILPLFTTSQFLLAATIVTILPYLFAALACTERPQSLGIYLLAVIQMVIFINVFSHTGMAMLRQTYVPGLITALAVNLPFSVYFFYTILSQKWLNGKALLIIFPIALLLHGPGLVSLLLLSGWVVGSY